MKRKYKIIGIIFIVLLIVLTLIFSIVHHYANVQKYEEAKLKQKVHHIFKQKGWKDKVKEEKNIFTFNTGDNDLQVTFKDEPYNTYTYSIDENNKVYGDAVLKDEYDKDFDSKKKYKEYLRFLFYSNY